MSKAPKPLTLKWLRNLLALADHVSTWSKDPKCKVGAVLVDSQCRVVGVGYNGLPRNVADSSKVLEDVKRKNELTVHAELNALLNCTVPTEGLYMFVTHHPCLECAKAIIQSGVAHVVCPPGKGKNSKWSDSHEKAVKLMVLSGTVTVHIMTDVYVNKKVHEETFSR